MIKFSLFKLLLLIVLTIVLCMFLFLSFICIREKMIPGLLFTGLILTVIFTVLHITVFKPLTLFSRMHKLNTTKDKLFSIIGHDLRSPLVSISQCLSYMINNKSQFTPQEFDELLNDTLKTVENTHKLVDNLIEWARTQKGEISVNPVILNIHEQIEKSITLLKVNAQHKGITIQNLIPRDAGVYADPGLFSVIIRNLLTNGLKFTNPGGTIWIEAGQTKKQRIITVRDNGVGLSSEEMGKLFKIEYSFSKRGTDNERGTGLGLILCKEFMEAHKGEIRLDSTLQKGTTFSLFFPFR